MTRQEPPILKPSSRAYSRPSTPGASFLHTTSLSGSTKYFSNTAEINKTLTPDALASFPTSPLGIGRTGGPEPVSRSKTSLILSLPEEETFGHPSIDLPGLNIVRDFGFGSSAGLRTSRIEERTSIVVAEEVKGEGEKSFRDVNSDFQERQIEERGHELELKGDGSEAMKERRIAEMLDRQADEEKEKSLRFFDRLKDIWESVSGKCCCS
ncbi:5628f402-e73c-49ce-9e36-613616d2f287-CDS [Sclerotinia trifoliorum]|uniref:5628f402-e73c-49ce-9e36-613616d2f287-CDS n=1 Tax=Sclerotinia trifoliorum TaxID=28548 RepID=A0A8H2W032_9HELO|nr:5628f402-e73c-49ce-9e36-613616d2f287-CDS [Sclerotinia trifoliorum]